MGKVVKAVAIIAIAVGVAYFAPVLLPGLIGTSATAAAVTSAIVSAAISTAVVTGLSLLAGKPSTSAGAPGVFRQAVSNSFIIYGKRRVGGLLIFFHPRGKEFRYFVIAVAGHRCKGVTRWWLGDEQVAVDASGKVLTGKYAGNAWLWFARGTEDQEANPTFVAETQGKWTANHRGRDTALIYAKFKMTDGVVQAGMPNITAEVEGKDGILDPRTNTRGYTRNASLVFYDWMAMGREEGGFGAYDDEIDWDWVAAQANVCDELVDTPEGSERRYELDCYIQTGAAPSEVRDTLVTCCAGVFTYSGGKMLMRPGYYVPPSATLKEADLAGPITVPALLAGDQMANEVTGTYIEPNKYQPADVPTRSLYATDVRQASFDLPHITSIYRGQRILEIYLRKAQAERRVTWPMNIMGIAISTLDTVQLGTPRYGLSNYAFQVTSWGLNPDFSVGLQLEETGPELFEFAPDMYLDPGETGELALAEPISDAAPGSIQAAIATSFPIGLTISAADTGVVTISAHTRRYTDGHPDVAVNGTSIETGLAPGAFRAIGYDDEARVGGAVAYQLFEDDIDARAAPDHPGRHYLGYAIIPTAGSPPSSGGGATPPGGQCVATDTPILMADGTEKPAGDIVVGDCVRTRHELRLNDVAGGWGIFPVEAVEIANSEDVWEAEIGGRLLHATGDHLAYVGTWRPMREIGAQVAGAHRIVKMTVTDAHTYVSNGILSHNIKMNQPEQPSQV